ncbi:MAG: hypothetical protein K8S20_01900 [Chloroflexi bacterium]|nr:hypothetical protein [Chloroflexota bacterium]
MKKILFPILALILVACATSQVTTTSEVIASLPPSTMTIVPTPTLNPQFVFLQEQIADSGNRFALLPDGTIQETTLEGIKIIPGISVDNEGQIRLMVNGEEVVLSLADMNLNEIDGIKIKGFTYDEHTNEWAKTKFQVNDDYKNFLECYVPPEAILDKSYVEYLKTLDWPDFDLASLKFQVMVKAGNNNQYENLTYDFYTAPNYPDPKTRPFQRKVFCHTIYNETFYGVVPTRYYSNGVNPQDYPWVIGLIYLGPVGEGESSVAGKQSFMNTYVEEMNFPVYKMTNLLFPPGFTPIPDPLPTAIFEKYPDMQARFDAFIAGDPTSLDGIALPVEDISLGKYYK